MPRVRGQRRPKTVEKRQEELDAIGRYSYSYICLELTRSVFQFLFFIFGTYLVFFRSVLQFLISPVKFSLKNFHSNSKNSVFSQHSISPKFQNGGTLEGLIADLKKRGPGVLQKREIKVVQYEDCAYSADNRRLYCYKQAFPLQKVVCRKQDGENWEKVKPTLVWVKFYNSPADYGADRFFDKFSTQNDGVSVEVRR